MTNKRMGTKPVARERVAKQATLSADEVKTRLREQGLTIRDWATKHGYPYATVSCVLRGVNRATYGMGHRIATQLGLK